MTKFLNKYFEVTNKRFNNLNRNKELALHGKCPWCPTGKGCNAWSKWEDRSWKRFRKTQYKNE